VGINTIYVKLVYKIGAQGIDFFNTIVQLVIFFAVFQQVYLLTANFAAARYTFLPKK
jgi:hypothetical protein